MNTEQYDQLVERLERLEKLMIAATPPSRRPARLCAAITKHHPPDALDEARVDELLRIFRLSAGLHRVKKITQAFPRAIVQPPGSDQTWPIVPVSILVNRARLRRIFHARPDEDTSSEENVNLTITLAVKRGLLVLTSVLDLFPDQRSAVHVVVDPAFVQPREGKQWQRDEAPPEKRRVGRPAGKLVWPEDQHDGEPLSAENAPEYAPDMELPPDCVSVPPRAQEPDDGNEWGTDDEPAPEPEKSFGWSRE